MQDRIHKEVCLQKHLPSSGRNRSYGPFPHIVALVALVGGHFSCQGVKPYLAEPHACVHYYRKLAGYFECELTIEARIAESSCLVYFDEEATNTALTIQDRDVLVGVDPLSCVHEIAYAWLQNPTLLRVYLELVGLELLLRIQNIYFSEVLWEKACSCSVVSCKERPVFEKDGATVHCDLRPQRQVHASGIHMLGVERVYFDRPFVYLLEYFFAAQDHDPSAIHRSGLALVVPVDVRISLFG